MSSDFTSPYSKPVLQQAPCKVNLTLDVFPPRPDGFHELDSIVIQFSPSDEIECAYQWDTRQSVELICDDSTLPTDERNLAYRAAALFASKRDIGNYHIRVDLRKRLPHQAGLGGGSSDAAAVLKALSRRFEMKPEKLAEIAAEIGSDVPLFLEHDVVRMRGRGEIISSLWREPSLMLAPRLGRLYGVLVKPGIGVPTGPAYKLLDDLPNRVPGNATERLIALLKEKNIHLEAIAAVLGNDFEQAVLPAFPEVAEAHQAVADAGALCALLCGSGSAIFGLARDRQHAEVMANTLRDRNRYPWVEVAESIF